MAATGTGMGGYVRVQKETTFNTAASADMTLLPVAPDSKLAMKRNQIENDVQVGQKYWQLPNLGREVNQGAFSMDIHPAIIGEIFNLAFGASDNDTDNADGTYTHAWIQALTCEREGTSFTYEQALGCTDLAERITGCTIYAIHLTGDNEGNLKIAVDVVGKNFETDIARITTFTYPSQIPYNFANVVLNVNPTDIAAFDINVTSFTLDIDLNYDIERFKSGSDSILQPVFNGTPIVNLSVDVDAEQKFVDYARAITPSDLTMTVTSTQAASGSTPWDMTVELPSAILSADTEIPNTQERMSMTLDYDCRYGGTTTNSGADSVMFEIGCTDLESTYTA